MQVHYAPCLAGAMVATYPVPFRGRGAVSSTGTGPFQGEQGRDAEKQAHSRKPGTVMRASVCSARKKTMAVLVQAACLSCAAPSVRGVEHPAEVRGLYCMEVVDNALLIVAGQMLQDNTLAEFSGSHTRKSGAPDTLDKLRYESISDKTNAALLIEDSGIGMTKKALGDNLGNELQDNTFEKPSSNYGYHSGALGTKVEQLVQNNSLAKISGNYSRTCNAPVTLDKLRYESVIRRMRRS